MFVDNILSAYVSATRDEREHGIVWYPQARELALELSPDDVWRGAGVIAALSPLKQWEQNEILARRAFATGHATGNIGIHNRIAQKILDGAHPLDVMRGDKTRNFTQCIVTGGTHDVAVIDRHAYDIAMARVHRDSERNIGKRVYAAMAEAYTVAAHWTEHTTAEMQAITWVAWRRMKKAGAV